MKITNNNNDIEQYKKDADNLKEKKDKEKKD